MDDLEDPPDSKNNPDYFNKGDSIVFSKDYNTQVCGIHQAQKGQTGKILFHSFKKQFDQMNFETNAYLWIKLDSNNNNPNESKSIFISESDFNCLEKIIKKPQKQIIQEQITQEKSLVTV